MINYLALTGRLTCDPKLNFTKAGVPVTTITLAVPQKYVKKDEERKTNFIYVVFWRHNAEFIAQNVKKGYLVGVEGYIQTREYEKDGAKTNVLEIIGDNITIFERNVRNNENQLESVQETEPAEEPESSEGRDS